jgi:hypothetical protein
MRLAGLGHPLHVRGNLQQYTCRGPPNVTWEGAKQLMNNNGSQKKSQQECTFIFEPFLSND